MAKEIRKFLRSIKQQLKYLNTALNSIDEKESNPEALNLAANFKKTIIYIHEEVNQIDPDIAILDNVIPHMLGYTICIQTSSNFIAALTHFSSAYHLKMVARPFIEYVSTIYDQFSIDEIECTERQTSEAIRSLIHVNWLLNIQRIEQVGVELADAGDWENDNKLFRVEVSRLGAKIAKSQFTSSVLKESIREEVIFDAASKTIIAQKFLLSTLSKRGESTTDEYYAALDVLVQTGRWLIEQNIERINTSKLIKDFYYETLEQALKYSEYLLPRSEQVKATLKEIMIWSLNKCYDAILKCANHSTIVTDAKFFHEVYEDIKKIREFFVKFKQKGFMTEEDNSLLDYSSYLALNVIDIAKVWGGSLLPEQKSEKYNLLLQQEIVYPASGLERLHQDLRVANFQSIEELTGFCSNLVTSLGSLAHSSTKGFFELIGRINIIARYLLNNNQTDNAEINNTNLYNLYDVISKCFSLVTIENPADEINQGFASSYLSYCSTMTVVNTTSSTNAVLQQQQSRVLSLHLNNAHKLLQSEVEYFHKMKNAFIVERYDIESKIIQNYHSLLHSAQAISRDIFPQYSSVLKDMAILLTNAITESLELAAQKDTNMTLYIVRGHSCLHYLSHILHNLSQDASIINEDKELQQAIYKALLAYNIFDERMGDTNNWISSDDKLFNTLAMHIPECMKEGGIKLLGLSGED